MANSYSMTKDNILFAIIGVLLGFIVGFMFANTVNQRGSAPAPAQNANRPLTAGALPEGHPPLGPDGRPAPPTLSAEDQAAIERARNAPDDFDAQRAAGEIYYRTGQFNDAREYLLRANQLRPDNYETVVRLGNANYEMGEYTAAERWYQAALTMNANDVDVRSDLGLTFLLRNPPDLERAISEFRGALARNPRHELALQNLTYVLIQKRDAAGAQESLGRLAEVNPNNRGLARLRADLEQLRAQPSPTPAAQQRPAANAGRRRQRG